MTDPTKEEMLALLKEDYGDEESSSVDAEIAMYWFANNYHSGQASNLYSVLSASAYKPGPLAKNIEDEDEDSGVLYLYMYETLIDEFDS